MGSVCLFHTLNSPFKLKKKTSSSTFFKEISKFLLRIEAAGKFKEQYLCQYWSFYCTWRLGAKKVHRVKVGVTKIGYFFPPIFSRPEIFEKMTSFFLWLTKSAKLANFDGFLQKCCLKKCKVLFDAFISIKKRTYSLIHLFFLQKSTKGVKGVLKGYTFKKIMFFFKILTCFENFKFYPFFVGLQSTISLLDPPYIYYVNWSNRKKVMGR